MVKLVCCDVDNTLLFDKNGAISSETFSVIEKLCSRGILFAAVSGRPVADMLRLFAPVAEKIIIVAYDGAVVLYKGKPLFDRPIEKNIYMAFIESFSKNTQESFKGEYIIYTLSDAFVTDSEGIAAAGMIDSVSMIGHILKIALPETIDDPVYKLSLISEESGFDFDFVSAEWSDYLNNIYSGERWCEFVSKNTDKGFAVNMIMERFGVRRDEAMAFGDGENDISMLSSCDFSYAMESASENTKAVAAFVTDDAVRSIVHFFNFD